MPEIQPDIIDPQITVNPPGVVNAACRFDDHDGRRVIQIYDTCFHVYDLEDATSERFIWVQVHLGGHASLEEIAAATGLALRSLERWKMKVVRGGCEALARKPIPGRPRTVTTVIKRQVIALIGQAYSHDHIQKRLGIGGSTIDRIVAEDKSKHHLLCQAQLGFEQEEEQSETPYAAPQPMPEVLCTGQAQGQQSGGDELSAVAPEPHPDNAVLALDRNPLDRSMDRALACAGLLTDATPLFAPGQALKGMGLFMVAVLLSNHPLLATFQQVYRHALAPAFYGLRTVVMTVLFMALLRIKRPEQLRQHNAPALGRVLGLDRIMGVKTLRRKLHRLASLHCGAELMQELGRARLEGQPVPPQGSLEMLYIDGHVKCYYGGFKIGQTWSTTRNRTVKGRTDTWLHLRGQKALFYLESPFNESLMEVIEKGCCQIEQIFGHKPVLAFDREGWDVASLDRLDKAGWKFVTYRKGNYPALPLSSFEERPTRIGKRSYAHAPVDMGQQSFNLYEKTTSGKGKPVRRKVGVRMFREVRVLSDDGVKQTSIVTNLDQTQGDAVVVSEAMFGRWGNQENVFKYMKAEYDLDAMLEYNGTGKDAAGRLAEEQIAPGLDHPNPEYLKLTRRIKELAEEQIKLLAHYGIAIEKDQLAGKVEGVGGEKLAQIIDKIRTGEHGQRLQEVSRELEQARVQREACEPRELVAKAGYVKLRSGVKQIADALKMCAYDLETQLFEMLAGHYPNRHKEGRKLIVAALKSQGSLRLEAGKILIKLDEQSEPKRTQAIDAICCELNRRRATFPGTDLVIQFDTDRSL